MLPQDYPFSPVLNPIFRCFTGDCSFIKDCRPVGLPHFALLFLFFSIGAALYTTQGKALNSNVLKLDLDRNLVCNPDLSLEIAPWDHPIPHSDQNGDRTPNSSPNSDLNYFKTPDYASVCGGSSSNCALFSQANIITLISPTRIQ